MRKFIPYLFLGLACFLWPSWSTGQTNVVVGDTAGSSSYFYGPIYRSSSGSSFNYSFYGAIYEASDLAIPIGTSINSISWKKQSAFTITGGLANFTIRMRNSNTSSFAGTQRYDSLTSAGYTTVYSSTSQDITGAANTWVTFTFTTPFVYNGGSIIVSTDWNRDGGTSNGALNWYYETKTGKAVGYASSLAPTASSTTSSSYSDRRPAVRLNVTYPVGACFPPSNLMASATTATTGSASWTSGGAANSLVEYGPSGFTIGTGTKMYVSTTSANLTSLSANTTYDVYVKDSCTTGASPFIGPMSFTTPCATVMNGAYTINSGLPTGGTNFNSFSAAAAELSVCGISGPVTINVVQGTYSEQFALTTIPGASSTNTVVIQPAAANTLPVEVTYAASGSGDNYVMQLTGTSYLTVRGITLTPTGGSNGRAIELYGNCSHVTIEDNILNGVATSTTSNQMAVIYNGTATVDTISNMTIRGNTITNGSYGVYIYGTFSAYAMNNTIDSNMVTDFYYMGVYSYYQENLKINGNTIVQNSIAANSTGYGIYNFYGDFSSVVGNTVKLYSSTTIYGIYTYFCDASSSNPNLIANNMVSCVGNSGTTYGIYPYNNYYTDIVFNSINVTAGSSTAGRGIYLNSSTSGTYGFVNLKNNNVSNVGGGYAVEVSSGAVTLGYVTSSDYNNLYATGTTLARVNNSNYADLAAYQLAVPTFDQNSVSDAPLFVAPDDLHVSSPTLNNAGNPYAGITMDIDGEMRSATTPDIGADEFTPPSCLPSSGLTLVTAYADSAVVAWRSGSGASYILEFDTTGFTQGLGTTVTGIVDTFYTITGLTSSTSYDFYIQNNCGTSGLSPFAGPVSFNTLIAGPRNISCGPGIALDTVLTEEFDNTTSFTGDFGTSNGTWQYDNNTTGSGSTGPSGPHSGSHYIYAETSTGGSDTMRMVSPAIDLSTATTAAEMSFWLHAYGATIGVLNVGVSTSATGPFATQFSFGPGQLQTDELDPYQNVGVNLDAFLGQIIYVQFEYIRGSSFTGDLAIDLVEVMTCPDPCSILAAPYTETFDGSTTPNCWSQSATTGGPWRFTGSANSVFCAAPSDHTGNAGSYAWMDQSGSDAGVILQMPVINVSALTVPYLDFYYWMCGAGYSPPNITYIETYDGTNWTVFDSITTATTGWENKGFDLSTAVYNTNFVQVRFRAESGGSGSDFYGDNSLDDVSIIEAPSCFLPSALGASNITTNSADIYWTTGGAANWNVEYGIAGFTPGTGTMLNATNDTVSLTGLAASATYEFYVRDSCGLGDVSAWAGPLTFSTLCGVILPPSLENFNNGFPPNCWDEADGGTPLTGPTTLGTGAWGDDGFGNVGTSGAARINLYNLGDEDWVLSPLYDLTGGPWNAEFDFGVYLWANTGVGTLGSDDQVQFLISLDTGATWTMLAMYDSSYVTAPGGNHEVINLSAYSGNIVMFAVWATEGAVDDPEDNDIFFDNFAVVDPCATLAAPYTETFDGSTTPNCWSQSATTGGPWRFTGSANSVFCAAPSDHTGNAGSYAWMDQSGSDAGVILQMPVINVSALTVPYLDFYYWMCGAGYSPPNITYIETYDGTNWTVFDSITTATTGWENKGFDLSTAVYNTNFVQVRFRAESGGSGSDFYGDNSLDDVSIIEAPSCFLPSALGASNITTNSADIYWTTGGAANWNVEYGIAGFTPGTGTMLNATNDTVSLTGLAASATYEFYVRDSCGLGDVSAWAGPLTFSTLCGVILPPSLENFNNGFPPNCWDEADGGTPLTGPTTLGTGAWGDDGFGNVGTSGAARINLYNLGDEDWVLSPLYDLTGGPWNAEFDFGVYLWANTGVGTLGSDDQVQFLISLDTGATWTMLAMYDSSYVTAPGGNHEVINLSAYSGNIVMFAVWATEGAVDDPEDNDIFFDNFAVVDPCAVITAPYTESFDGNSIPSCWSQSATTGGPWAFSGSTNSVNCTAASDHTGNSGSFTWMDHSGTDAGVILEMPMVNVSALTTPYLEFYYWMCGVGYTPVNPLYIETFDGTNWTVFDSITVATVGWEDFGFDLTTAVYNTDKVKVRFRTESGGSTSDFLGDPALDDVSIMEAPSCFAPSNLGVTNLSTTSVDLFWTSGGAANYNVQYGLGGFTLGTGTMINSTNDTLSIGSLTAATGYEFYVRDSCAVGDVSVWVGPFAFSTTVCPPANACGHTVVLSDLFGDGWNGTEVTVYQNGSAIAVLGPNFTSATGNPPGDTLVTTLSLCDNLNTYFVITTGTNGSPNWTEEIGVEVLNAFNLQVAFYDDNPLADQGDTIITFLSSCAAPACIPPSALGSFNITQNSADIYWTPGQLSATSVVEYGVTGFTPGTGTIINATNDTITLSSLLGSTAYTFCVTDSCGIGNVSATVCASFTTSCAVFVAPFLETFDGTTRPLCWSDTATSGGPWVYGGAGTNSVNCPGATDHTGNSGNYAWMDQSGTDAAVVLQTPVVDVASITLPYLDFFYWMCGSGYTPNNKTFLEYWSGTNWVVFDSIVDSTLGWEYYAYDLTGKTYSTSLVQLRFRAESGGSGSDFFGDNAIDDVFIGEKRICLDPTGLVITATSLNSVTLAWNSDTNITASLIEYGPTGFVLGTGTQIPAGAGGGVVANLAPGTCYDFYIADSCGSSLLAWIGPVNGCTASPCTVTTTPTNVMGDTTACGGGLVNLTATSTGNVAWVSGGEVVGTGSPFTPDSIFFTTNYTAYDYVKSGPSVHVGPLPSIATAGFGNFSNGQWISVQDTVTIDSTTVRANGYVNAQVWILDPAQTRVIQRGEVFETDSNVTANYQVPVGIVLTPGVYYMAIDFDITAVSLGALFRATGGAVYPYVAAGLMSIDSVNFAGARYYYTFDLVINGACLGAPATPVAVGFVPGANAGSSDSVGVCITNTSVDLSTYLGVHDPGGVWSDDNSTGALTGGIFNASAVTPGTYNFTYRLAGLGGCSADSATIQVTVVNGGSAGADTTIFACTTGASVQLRNYVGTTGGIFTNLDNASGVVGGSLIIPASAGAGTFRFRYRLPAGVCPADTAILTVVIDASANAGANASDTVCDTLNAIDLTTYLDANAVAGGTWKDVNGSGGLTGSTFDATAVISNSAYVLRYVVDNGCGQDSADITLFVGCNISLNEFGIATLEVYPNPTSGVVNIRSINSGSQSVTIELYSTSGKLLISKTADLDGELPLDISRFADGVYNLKITTDEGTEVHRISKM